MLLHSQLQGTVPVVLDVMYNEILDIYNKLIWKIKI